MRVKVHRDERLKLEGKIEEGATGALPSPRSLSFNNGGRDWFEWFELKEQKGS